jgi:hypothetical protein
MVIQWDRQLLSQNIDNIRDFIIHFFKSIKGFALWVAHLPKGGGVDNLQMDKRYRPNNQCCWSHN